MEKSPETLNVVACNPLLRVSTVVVSMSAGDLKLVEKPQPITMGPHDFTNIKASMKVASTENGIIFGNIGEHLYPALPMRNRAKKPTSRWCTGILF